MCATAATGANQIPVPDTSDVTAVAGTELSDVEKEAIEDPSTADLLAAATADDSAAAAANDAPVPTNVVTMKEDGTSEVPAAAARGKKVGTSSDRTAAAAAAGGGTAAAECDLQHSMSILTASDAAAFGLANLESQLDSGKGYSRPGSSCSSRSGSVMSRSETGNIIDFTSPAAARDTLPDHMLESVESGNAADDQSVPATAAAAAGGSGNTDPADFGVAAAYGHLQQAPAAADDPAAVPAAADLPPGSSSNDGSSDVAAGPTKVKSAKLPTEPAVSADKDEEVVSDAAAGGTGAAAAEPEAGSSENPLAAAVEAVAQPVAAALTNLKDVFIGPDIKLGGDSESTQDKKE